MKTILAGLLILGSISVADAMPTAQLSSGVSLPVVKAAIVIVRRRRPPIVRRRVVRKVIIRR